MSTILTGVGAVFCAAHQPKGGGPMHGHTWEVIVWLPRCDAVEAQGALVEWLQRWDHGVLPDELSQAEDLAAEIGAFFAWSGDPAQRPVRVQVNRPLERIYAEWLR